MKFEHVLVSGQAGLMAAQLEARVVLFRQGEEDGHAIPRGDLRFVFSGCDDVVEAVEIAKQDALDLLELECRHEQALHAALALLNAGKYPGPAAIEAKRLDLWLDFDLHNYLEDTFYSRPLPPRVDFAAVSEAVSGHERAALFWKDLSAYQSRIGAMHALFEAALEPFDASAKRVIYARAVQASFFRRFIRGAPLFDLELAMWDSISDLPHATELLSRLSALLAEPDAQGDPNETLPHGDRVRPLDLRRRKHPISGRLYDKDWRARSVVVRKSSVAVVKQAAVDESGKALPDLSIQTLIRAGAHFGHYVHNWNPKMKPYIFGQRGGVHIIDLSQTVPLFARGLDFINKTVASGGKVLFVGTKRQARDAIAKAARKSGQHFINHRWPRGMLVDWKASENSIRRLESLEEQLSGDTSNLSRQEVFQLIRERKSLETSLGGIRGMGGLPGVMFVIDAHKEQAAIREANALGIPVVAILDTNVSPDGVAFPIPGNDDSARAIRIYCAWVAHAAKRTTASLELDFLDAGFAFSDADLVLSSDR